MSKVRVGICSWTDPTLTGSDAFYPKRSMTAEERLRFYASNFDTVEVDSTYYALPSEKMVGLHVERTPPEFIIHYKAFALMTQHNFDPQKLPLAIKDGLPQTVMCRKYICSKDISTEKNDLAWQMFTSALRPAHHAGKLGVVLFQFPPFFSFNENNFEYLKDCRHRLPDYKIAIEFRHSSWVLPKNIDTTLEFLKARDFVYVSVDEPQIEDGYTVPPIAELTSDISYIRFHGRNTGAWFKKGVSAAERFAYQYSEDELQEWLPKIQRLAEMSKETFAMMNNCFQDYAIKSARKLMAMM